MENIYYCYVYLDTRKPGTFEFEDLKFDYEPFYIGKGKNRRSHYHLIYVKRRIDQTFRHHFLRKIKKILEDKLEPEIIFLKRNISEKESYVLETSTIEKIGLSNLTNIFPGGKGGRHNKNFAGKKHSIEAKRKMSIAHKGKLNPMYGDKYFRSKEGSESFSTKTSGEKHHYFNAKRDDKTKEKISKSLMGFEWTDEEKKKRSRGMKKVWEQRKAENIKISNPGTSKKIKLYNAITSKEIILNSQRECSEFFNLDFRTIKKRIRKHEPINNYIISWI